MYKSFAFAALLAASQAVQIRSNTETKVILSQETETLLAETTQIDPRVYCASRTDKIQCRREVECLNKPTTRCKAQVACYKAPTAKCIIDAWQDDDVPGKLNIREARNAYFYFYPQDSGKVYDWDIYEWVDTSNDYEVTADELAAVNVTEIPALRRQFRWNYCKRQPTPACVGEYFDLDGNTTTFTLQEARNAYFAFFPEDEGKVSFEQIFKDLDTSKNSLLEPTEVQPIFAWDWEAKRIAYREAYCIQNPTPDCIVEHFSDDGVNSLNFREASNAYFTFFPEDSSAVYFWDIYEDLDTNHDYELTAEELIPVFSPEWAARREEYKRKECERQGTAYPCSQ